MVLYIPTPETSKHPIHSSAAVIATFTIVEENASSYTTLLVTTEKACNLDTEKSEKRKLSISTELVSTGNPCN